MAMLLTCSMAAAQSDNSLVLKQDAQATVTGVLRVQWRGWNRYLVLMTKRNFRPVYAHGDLGPSTVQTIEILLRGQNDAVAKLAGRGVTAHGTMQIEPASSSYWNGVLMAAETVTAGKSVLRVKNAAALSVKVQRYSATVTLVPKVYSWKHAALDLETKRPLLVANADGCSLNGAGTLLNCTCAAGFKPVRAGLIGEKGQSDPERLREVDRSLPGTAQLQLPEVPRHPLSAQLLCTRTKDDN